MHKIYCLLVGVFLFEGASALADKVNFTVIEGRPTQAKDNDTLLKNLQRYQDILKKDIYNIIVLPEYGLTGVTNNTDCAVDLRNATTKDALTKFASLYKAIVVANVLEKDGDDLYSTTLAINSSGNLQKYRKINLSQNEKFLKAAKQIVVFDSAYGKIGLCAGEDLIHQNTSQELINAKAEIVICTSSMRSRTPFNMTLSVQQGFAEAYDVILAVANINDPSNGYSGSGIYTKNENTMYISGSNGSEVLFAQYSKTKLYSNTNSLTFKTTDTKNLVLAYELGPPYEVKSVNQNSTVTITLGGFSCFLNVTAKWNNDEKFGLVAKNSNQQLCALTKCDEHNGNCGNFNGTSITKFDTIEISVTNDEKRNFRPYTLQTNYKPVTDTSHNFTRSDKNITITSKGQLDNLLVFGIITPDQSQSLPSTAYSIQTLAGFNMILLIFLKYVQ